MTTAALMVTATDRISASSLGSDSDIACLKRAMCPAGALIRRVASSSGPTTVSTTLLELPVPGGRAAPAVT